MTQDIAYLSATRLIELFRSKKLSPVEAVKAALDRIETHYEALNAFCLIDQDAAFAAARESEARWSHGEPKGLVDGVPVSIKDLLLTKGWPTLRGSKAVARDQPWDEDAPPVARLREHGAVLLGKTATPEFGWKGVTDSPLTGISRNPWDQSKTPGGSSGGSAAAVAAGMGPLSVGTDGGGSIRIPASFCGTVGLKANFGRVPVYPGSPFGSLAHAGPITRTVADAALMLTVLAEPDARDGSALPYEKRDYREGLDAGVVGLRIAFSPDLGYARVHEDIAPVVAEAARAFEALGAVVEQTDPGFDDPYESFLKFWYPAAARVVGAYSPERQSEMDPDLRKAAGKGARYSLEEYLDAVDVRARLGATMRRFHETYDLLVTPTMPIPAFTAGQIAPPEGPEGRWIDWTPFTYPFNFTGQPAISVPCGFTEAGLPVGLQIVASNYADALLLRAAQAYQTAHPTSERRPDL